MKRDSDKYNQGKQQGITDISQGYPKLFWQTRSSWGELFTRLMADRFQVIVQHISDMATDQEVAYQNGYNSVIIEHVDQVFGQGSFQSVLDEIERYRQDQYQLYLESKGDNIA